MLASSAFQCKTWRQSRWRHMASRKSSNCMSWREKHPSPVSTLGRLSVTATYAMQRWQCVPS